MATSTTTVDSSGTFTVPTGVTLLLMVEAIGKGGDGSLASASHGAGRVMSRTKAEATFDWSTVNPILRERNVRLLSAGIDEVPMVYKDIHQVMAAQTDLVEVLAEFMPRLVKMAPSGERPED